MGRGSLPESVKIEKFEVCKVDESLGLVFGFAIVCKIDGEDYYDLNVDRDGPLKGKRVPEHIPEDVMLKAALDFSENTERPGNEMHKGPERGQHVFVFPLTSDIADSLEIQTRKTGLLIAYKAPAEVLAKYASGEYRGFSIEGYSGGELEVLDDAA